MIRLFLLFFLAFTSTNVFSQNLSAYNNAEGRYAFTPLAGWTVRINGSESYVYAPADGDMDELDEKVEFSITDGEEVELEDAFDFYITTDFPAMYGQFQLVAQGDEEINGLKAKWATFTFSAQGSVAGSDEKVSAILQVVFYVVKKNNSLYLMNGVTKKSLFPKFDPSFRSIIRTLRIKE